MKRVLMTVAVVATAILLLLLLWYGIYVFLLVFASVLLAILLYNVSHFVSAHTPLPYGWSLTLVTLVLIAIVMGYFVVFLALGLYLAIDPGVYVRGLVRLVPRPRRGRVQEVLNEVGSTLGHWLLGRIVSMFIVGGITTLGLWLIGVPLAPALGLLAALAEFVPNIGPFLAFALALLLALTESTTRALAVLLLYLGVQGFESYVLTPLVEKRAVALPPVLTITSQVLLGVLAGGMGFALATPLAAASLVLIQRFYIEDTLGDSMDVPASQSIGEGENTLAYPDRDRP